MDNHWIIIRSNGKELLFHKNVFATKGDKLTGYHIQHKYKNIPEALFNLFANKVSEEDKPILIKIQDALILRNKIRINFNGLSSKLKK